MMDSEQYSLYYVAFLDILGFKDLVKISERSCGDILNIYKYSDQYPNTFFMFLGNELENIRDRIKMKIMSDSICIYTKADIPSALHDLVMFCTLFQYNLLVIEPCVFIRGGIAYGDMYVKDNIIFGPALIDAYLLEENNARVPRIIMCKSTLDRGRAEADERLQSALDNWTFRDSDAFYTLDYFSVLTGDVLHRVNRTVSKWLDSTTNESIRQKYLYVENQIHQRLEKKAET